MKNYSFCLARIFLLQAVTVGFPLSAGDLLEKFDFILIISSYFSWWQQLDPLGFLFLDLYIHNSLSLFLNVMHSSFLNILVALPWALAIFSKLFLHLDAMLLMWSNKSWTEGNNHFPLVLGLCGWLFYMLFLASGMLACSSEVRDVFLVILNCHRSVDSKMTKAIYTRWWISSWSDEAKIYFVMPTGAEVQDCKSFHWNQWHTVFDALYMFSVS